MKEAKQIPNNDLTPEGKEVLQIIINELFPIKAAKAIERIIKVQRLEGMIEVYKYVIYNRPQPYDIRPLYKELKQQLKELKGIKTCSRCKLEFTKEELLTNEHCFNCGKEMSGF